MQKFKSDVYMPTFDDDPQPAVAWILVKFDEMCKRGDAIDQEIYDDDHHTEHVSYIALQHPIHKAEVYGYLRDFIFSRPDYWGLSDCTAKPPHEQEERKYPLHVWYTDQREQIIGARTHKPVLEIRIHDAYLFQVDGDMLSSAVMGTHFGCYDMGTHMLGMAGIHSHHTTFWSPKLAANTSDAAACGSTTGDLLNEQSL